MVDNRTGRRIDLRQFVRTALLASACAFITLWGASAASRILPYSNARDAITDAISLPGGIIAAMLGFAGPHGGGAENWATVAMLSNWVFYFGLWLVVILAWKAWTRRTATSSS
jgi:hypothetical protein